MKLQSASLPITWKQALWCPVSNLGLYPVSRQSNPRDHCKNSPYEQHDPCEDFQARIPSLVSLRNRTSDWASYQNTKGRCTVESASPSPELPNFREASDHSWDNRKCTSRCEPVKDTENDDWCIPSSWKPHCKIENPAEESVNYHDIEDTVHVAKLCRHNSTKDAEVVSVCIPTPNRNHLRSSIDDGY